MERIRKLFKKKRKKQRTASVRSTSSSSGFSFVGRTSQSNGSDLSASSGFLTVKGGNVKPTDFDQVRQSYNTGSDTGDDATIYEPLTDASIEESDASSEESGEESDASSESFVLVGNFVGPVRDVDRDLYNFIPVNGLDPDAAYVEIPVPPVQKNVRGTRSHDRKSSSLREDEDDDDPYRSNWNNEDIYNNEHLDEIRLRREIIYNTDDFFSLDIVQKAIPQWRALYTIPEDAVVYENRFEESEPYVLYSPGNWPIYSSV